MQKETRRVRGHLVELSRYGSGTRVVSLEDPELTGWIELGEDEELALDRIVRGWLNAPGRNH